MSQTKKVCLQICKFSAQCPYFDETLGFAGFAHIVLQNFQNCVSTFANYVRACKFDSQYLQIWFRLCKPNYTIPSQGVTMCKQMFNILHNFVCKSANLVLHCFLANMACKFCLTAARFRRFERQKLGLHICELGGKQLQACFLLQRLQT